MTAGRTDSNAEKIVVVALALVGIVQLIAYPRRTLRMLRGGQWIPAREETR